MGRYITTRRLLVVVAVLAWAGLILESFTNVLELKAFALACVVAALAPVLLAVRAHSDNARRAMMALTMSHCERLERATKEHSERIERALEHQAQVLGEHQAVIQKISDIWNGANAAVEQEKDAWAVSPSDTGPFPLFDRRRLS